MKRKILPILLTSFLFASLTISSGHVGNNKQIVDGWINNAPIVAELGDRITLPDVSFVEGGATVPSTKITTYPDGSEKLGNTIDITMSGQYKVTYTADVSGTVHSKVEEFFVNYPQIHVNNRTDSSIHYVSSPSEEGIKADKPGLHVSLAYGDTLSFSKPIPLSDLTAENALLKLYVVPQQHLTADFSALTLTLTNPDDVNNYVKIVYYSHVETNANGSVSHSSSVCARSDAVNVFAGIHQSQGLHTNDKYGMWSGCTFDGYVQESYHSDKYDYCMFYFGYDDTTKQTYGTGFNLGKTGDPVLDLDNPGHVRKLWGGFTGDRVLLSINCDSYSSKTADFIITEIFGASEDEIKNNVYYDREAPVVSLDEEKELPNGAIGYNYPIPSASAYDKICLDCPVNVDVYKNYDSESRIKVKVVDNKFRMDDCGLYSIIYSSKDYAGNVGKLIKSVSVFNELRKPEFELPSHLTTADVGSYIKLEKNIDVKSYCGDTTLKTYFKSATGEKTLADDGFRIDKLETYTVYYEVSDLIGQITEKSYTINVTNNNLPILEQEITFPRYLISRGYYKVPTIGVYLWENNQLVRKDGNLIMTCGSSSPIKYNNGEEYNPIVNSNGDITNLKIVYESTILQEDNVHTIKTTGTPENDDELILENYFVVKSGKFFLRPNTAEMGFDDKEKGAHFKSVSGEDLEFEFANFLLGNNFSIKVNKILNAINGTKLTITLYDAEDKNTAISASFEYDGTNTYFVVNNKRSICLDNPFNVDSSDCSYTLSFDGTSFGYNATTYYDVLNKTDGTPFYGFKSNNVFVNVKLSNCKVESRMTIETLCGYTFKNGTVSDITSPVIYISHDIGGTIKLNGVYTTHPMHGFDVLSPNVTFYMNVKNENGSFAKDINGNEMKNADPTVAHDIVLQNYGAYTFEIICQEDTRFLKYPNKTTISRVVYVYDDIKPVITMKEVFQDTLTLGSEVRFPEFSVSDNYTAAENIVVQRVYLAPNGKYVYMSDNQKTIKFDLEGIYKIMINAFDEYGNIATFTMYVTVSK